MIAWFCSKDSDFSTEVGSNQVKIAINDSIENSGGFYIKPDSVLVGAIRG